MNKTISVVLAAAVVLVSMAGCGNHPAPIHSARDIAGASSSENMVVIVSLPLQDWPKLKKFAGLEHFRVAEDMAPEITDAHVKALSRLPLPMLRQVAFAHCRQVTDAGLEALTNLPSIQGMQLIGTGITDQGMLTLATGFPRLRGVNVESCRLVPERGFLSLTNSRTITDVSLSLEPLSQTQVENIISTVSNVTWWTISDPGHKLDQARVRTLGESRKITIQVADENNSVKSITFAQSDGATNRSQPVR